MSVRNNEQTLPLALDSVISQTYQNFKIIVIDDASTDSTHDILLKYRDNDARFHVIHNEKQQGLADNLNVMLSMADTKFVARMDGDDVCYPTRFRDQMEYLLANPYTDILGTAADIIDDNGIVIGEMAWPVDDAAIKKTIWCNPMIHPTIMMKRQKILNIGGYPSYPRRQDYALWFKAVKAGYVFHNLPKPLIQYRIIQNHYKKNTWQQNLLQTKIGWGGYASIGGINPLHYCIMAWPVVRSFLPVGLQKYLQKTLRRFDPRHNRMKAQ